MAVLQMAYRWGKVCREPLARLGLGSQSPCFMPRLNPVGRALTLSYFPHCATFARFPFSFLEDVPHFLTFRFQPKIHSGPSTSNVSIHSPRAATLKSSMWKCTNRTPSTYMSYFLLVKMSLDTLPHADSLCLTLISPRSCRLCS